MQMTCRDRNRIALQSDLLGASALGIRNILVMTGDHPKFGDHPGAKPVFDLDSVQLLWTPRTMRDEHVLLSGRKLDPAPDCFLGAVENPFAPPVEFRADRLGKKVAAGAQFVQTQFVFDVPAFARWMAQVRDLGLTEHCAILAGVGAVRSLKRPGLHAKPRARGASARTRYSGGCGRCRRDTRQKRASSSRPRSSSRWPRSPAWPACTCWWPATSRPSRRSSRTRGPRVTDGR